MIRSFRGVSLLLGLAGLLAVPSGAPAAILRDEGGPAEAGPRGPAPAGARPSSGTTLRTASAGDSVLVLSHSFDDPGGGCSAQGWVGENRATTIYAHVSDRFVQNGVLLVDGSRVNMGTKALWIGADSTSAPDEVRTWVQPYGYGNGWSQRLSLPSFFDGEAVVGFDGYLGIGLNPGLTAVTSTSQRFLEVQAMRFDGIWTSLNARFWGTGAGPLLAGPVVGNTWFRCEVHLMSDGNNPYILAFPLQIRIVVQTASTTSNEDGGAPQGIGAAWIDNLTFKNSVTGEDALPPIDFEDGTIGACTLSAFNTGLGAGPSVGYVRDLVSGIPLPATQPSVASGVDPIDTSCVMQFTDASGYLPLGANARMTSPWFPVLGNGGFSVAFNARAGELGRFLRISVRTKRASDLRPTGAATVGLFFENVVDLSAPFEPLYFSYPRDFPNLTLGYATPDSAQIVFEATDQRDRFGTYNTGSPERVPLVDDVQVRAFDDGGGMSTDVSVTNAGPASATQGQTLNYSITAHNNGASTAVGVVVRDSLSPGQLFVGATSNGVFSSGVVTWPATALLPGASITRTVTVSLAGLGSLVNVARADAATTDPNPANNDGTASASRVTTAVSSPAPTSEDWHIEPAASGGAPADSFTVVSNAFDDLWGSCSARGWVGENRAGLVFSHVSGQFVQNGITLVDGSVVNMGTKALWVGADSISAPEEVRYWLHPYGYGNGWSQRLVSPEFSLAAIPDAVLRFDGYLDLASSAGLSQADNLRSEFLGVQGLKPDGTWVRLVGHFWSPSQSGLLAGTVIGKTAFRCEVRLDQDGNDQVGLAPSTRLRIVVQTDGTKSDEDGGVQQGYGAAWIDNLTLTSAGTGASIVTPLDFEDGTMGSWTATAYNTGLSTGPSIAYVRDPVTGAGMPAGVAGVGSNLDPADPACVMSFADSAGHLPVGAYSRMTSPWFPVNGDTFAIEFMTKAGERGRFFRIYIRGKRLSEGRPTYEGQTGFGYGETGADVDVPFEHVALRFPASFTASTLSYTLPLDSAQIVIEVYDHRDRFGALDVAELEHRPFFDDFHVNLFDVDADHDGVGNYEDWCSGYSSAGQETHAPGSYGYGCGPNYPSMRHVESWPVGPPIHYAISAHGDPSNNDGSDFTEIQAGFHAWEQVDGASLTIGVDPPVAQQISSSNDGINLVTFEDSRVPLPPNVVAVTPTLSLTRRTAFMDRIYLPGQIIDADMIMNPLARFSTPTHDAGPGSFDLRSVVTHEAGHFLGLSHSGFYKATMFFVLQPGNGAASLEDDDKSAIAMAYPAPNIGTDYTRVQGSYRRTYFGGPIPGALVYAVHMTGDGVTSAWATGDTIASTFTDENGGFSIARLPKVPTGYTVRVAPLDGNVAGYPLTPAYINSRVEASAQTDFVPEWWSGSYSEQQGWLDPYEYYPYPSTFENGSFGWYTDNAAIIANADVFNPFVASTLPVDQATQVHADATILVDFSEPIAPGSLQGNFRLHIAGTGNPALGGSGLLINRGSTFVFTPTAPLHYDTQYQLDLTRGLTDLNGNILLFADSVSFHTEPQPAVALSDIQPRAVPDSGYVTLVGAGFDAATTNSVSFTFCPTCTPVAVSGAQVTPSSFVARVPEGAVTGPVTVTVNGQTSNSVTLTVLPLGAQPAPSLTERIALPAGFSPSDVAIAPDGKTVYAVGPGGFATVNLDPSRPSFHVPLITSMPGARRMTLSPDGFRAFVTRRDSGDVVAVDADPTSGTFRQVLGQGRVKQGGGPDGIAVAGSGRRAYVTDATSGTIYELDTGIGSVTLNQVLREISDSTSVLTGGIAILPGSGRLLFTTGNASSRSFDLSGSSATVLNTGASAAAIAATPNGSEVLSLGGGTGSGNLLYVGETGGPASPGSIVLGGSLRDVAVSPQGGSAYVVNGTFNRIQVVDVNPASPTYHTRVAEAPTGRNPSAVAVSADGSTIALSEEGGSSIALFNTGATGQVARVIPGVAVPGSAVAITFTPGFDPAGATVELGAGASPVGTSHTVSGTAPAAAFSVPAGFTQGDLSLTVVDSGGRRMLATPFRVVDPIPGLAPQPTGVGLDLAPESCPPGSLDGSLRLRTSHAGGMLAVGRAGPCDARLEIHRAAAGPGEVLGERLASTVLWSSVTGISGLDWTPDDRAIWFCLDGALGEIDADPASPTFGAAAPIPGQPPGQLARAVAADPMGRTMIVTFANGDVTFWDPATRTLQGTLSTVVSDLGAVAVSPDGRYAIAGGTGRAVVLDLDSRGIAAVTPDRGGSAGVVHSVAITSNGRYAVGLFGDDQAGVWDLASGAGFAQNLVDLASQGASGATDVVAGAAPDQALIGCASSASLLRLSIGGSSASAPLGSPARALARSPDGRQLWVGRWTSDPSSGAVDLLSMTENSSLVLVSGAGQAALPGGTLPTPLRVRLVSAAGDPRAGVDVRFTAQAGSLDGEGALVHRATNANGEAQTSWTLPQAVGTYSLEASALGVTGGTVTVTAQAVASDAEIVPQVVEMGPATGSTGIKIDTPVFARFNQRMNQDSVAAKTTLEANGVLARGTFTFGDSGRVAIFQPGQTLSFSAVCKLKIAAGIPDLDGQTAAADSVTFTTQAQPSLSLASLSPTAATHGAAAVLAGSGFSIVPAQNVVLFNRTLASVESATADELRVSVPVGATTGPVTVSVGAVTSNPVTFTVAIPPAVMSAQDSVSLRPGIRHIAITPNGQRAYVTNPLLNTVGALALAPPLRLATITVGLKPQGIAILPDGSRAYVANTGSNDVSVIDVNPASPTYHQVTDVIPVDPQPVELGVSSVGPRVVVACADSEGTVSILDADPGHGTYNQVLAKTKTGSGSTSVTISADGGRAFVLNVAGELAVIDLAPGSATENQVVAKTNLGSGGTSVTISADGTILLVLLANGDLLVVDITPGSPTENQVVAKTNVGSGGQSVTISADGGTAFVSNGIEVLRFAIQIAGSGGSGSSIGSGPAVTLTPQASMVAGDAPAQVLFDPFDQRAFVVNEGSGDVTILGAGPTAIEPSPVATPTLRPSLELAGRSPAVGEARLRFTLTAAAEVRLQVFDVAGRRVSTLARGRYSAGPHMIWWHGESDGGGRVASGIYFVRLSAPDIDLHRRIVWLR